MTDHRLAQVWLWANPDRRNFLFWWSTERLGFAIRNDARAPERAAA